MIEYESLWKKIRGYACVGTLVVGFGTMMGTFTGCSSYEPKVKTWDENTCIHGNSIDDCKECEHDKKQ